MQLRVHIDAALRAPSAYLTAVWWRLCGKRLRARARFAPLLATSPLAYRLWLWNEAPLPESPVVGVHILALIEGSTDADAIAQTLQNLTSEGLKGLVIGSKETPDLAAAARQVPETGDLWLMPMAAGDVLASGAVAAYAATAAAAVTPFSLIYADDDLLDTVGTRSVPHFKPNWNAELYRHFDYLTGACIIPANAAVLADLSGPDWAARLVASAITEKTSPPHHVQRILHHRRVRPAPRVPATVAPFARGGPLPAVSVIVPTRNRSDLLSVCVDGLAATDYPDLEVIIVDNGSDDPATLSYLASLDPARYRVLRAPGPFNFSTLNNLGATGARGHLLCLLNNDIEMVAPNWLAVLVQQAMRPDVGAVGPQLLYPDGRIQHAGVVLGVGGGAAHAHRLLYPDEPGYFRRHALPQFVSAVTAACLVVKAERFAAVGGLNEDHFPVAFNDVDLCMRLNAHGWQSLYEPRAVLVHHESVSRGFDRDAVGAKRLAGELAALKTAWGTGGGVDPFHHPELSPFSERFVVRL